MKTRLATAYSVLFAFFILTVLILPATSAQAQQVQGKDAHAEAAEPTESAFLRDFLFLIFIFVVSISLPAKAPTKTNLRFQS